MSKSIHSADGIILQENEVEELNASETEEIRTYQEYINLMANSNSSEILPNAGAYHAAIVMAKLFEKTKNNGSANMIVGSFKGKVSNQSNYLNQLENSIDRNVSFRIIFLDNPNKNSKAFTLLNRKKEEGKSINFYQASKETKERFAKRGVHFAVFDDDKYRFEKDTENYMAWICFNDQQNASSLSSVFEDELKNSIPL
jgi:hypothetical protein